MSIQNAHHWLDLGQASCRQLPLLLRVQEGAGSTWSGAAVSQQEAPPLAEQLLAERMNMLPGCDLWLLMLQGLAKAPAVALIGLLGQD